MTRKTVTLLCACVALPACGDNKTRNNTNPDAGRTSDAPPADADIDAPVGPGPDAGMPGLSPVLAYAFEDVGATVADSSGHAFDGALTGDPNAIWATGRNGNGLHLQNPALGHAATQFVSLPSGVLAGVTDYSIAFWVRLDQNQGWQRIYDLGNGKGGADTRFAYFTPLGLPSPDVGLMADVFTAAGGGGGTTPTDNIINTQTQFPLGVWKHVAITSQAGVETVYIDGFPVGTLTGDSVPGSDLEPLANNAWLGRSRFDFSTTSSSTSDPGLDGTIDDFEIFNTVLSADDIATKLALPQKDYSYWRFDEATGTSAVDLSDNKNTGSLSGGAAWDTDARLGAALQLPGGPAGATGPMVEFDKNPLADCTTQLTFAAWVKVTALTPWTQIFEVTSDSGVPGEEWIDLVSYDGAAPHFAMITSTGDNLDLVASKNPFDDGTGHADTKWHHIAVTVAPDAGDATKNDVVMYADGVMVASATTAASVSAFTSATTGAPMTHAWIGKSRFPDPYLAGSLDDVRISCRAYTADEIKNLATSK